MKIEPIFEKDVEQSLKSPVWREIEFCRIMNKKYPDQFITLHDYKIDEKCNHEQAFIGDTKKLPKCQQSFYKKLFASTVCSVKLYSLIDMTIDELLKSWKTFNKQIFYNLVVQYVCIIYAMEKEGFIHRDLHTKNIGIIKTKKKYVTIFNKKILTHGFMVQAIDFGVVIHNKFILKTSEKKALKVHTDLFFVASFILNTMMGNLLFSYPKINIYEHVKINKEDGEILNNLLHLFH